MDPFLGPSYLLAGADILDGLSWLRHAFHEGRALDMQCLTAIERPDADFGSAAWAWRRGNLRKLDDLQVAMRRVAEGAPFREIGPLSDAIVALHHRPSRTTSDIDAIRWPAWVVADCAEDVLDRHVRINPTLAFAVLVEEPRQRGRPSAADHSG